MKSSTWMRWGLGALVLISGCADDVPATTFGVFGSGTGNAPTTTAGSTDGSGSTGIDSSNGTGSTGGSTAGPADTTAGDPTTGEPTTGDSSTGDSTGPGTVCGDDVIEGVEQCEGTDLAGEDCLTQGFDAGELACAGDCTLDATACIMFACGNDLLEGAEECDGADLAGETCITQGFDAGILGCAGDCTYDTTGCATFMCGNGMIEGMESCDGGDLAGETCLTQGFDAGILGCAGDCTYDTSGCIAFMCGNGVIEGMESCDGGALGGETCITQGFDAGILGCSVGCAYDTSGCITFSCGNGLTEGVEVCDGADLAGQSCATQGFDGGVLTCLGDCSGYDTGGCANFSGDCCAANGTPGCDDLGCSNAVCLFNPSCCNVQWDAACAAAAVGELACQGVGGSCPGGGPVCGNDVVEAGEFCDGADLGGEDCTTLGFAGGVLSCMGDCLSFDTAGCMGVGYTGDCCAANGSPGCDDAACTAAVCAIDPFCCSNTWDGICANEAIADPTCAGAGGSCGGGAVCGNGVAEAGESCDGGDLAGQTCVTQGFPGGGVLACTGACAFDTTGCMGGGFPCTDEDIGGATGAAVTSGNTAADDNDLDGSCGGAGGNDRVILFTAPVAGSYTFDTFGSGYDTKLSLFSDCATEISCNDDTGGLQSELVLNMAAGQSVLVVVDGFNGATGAWVLNITAPGGGGGGGDCCAANGTPGCDDLACETAICAADPFCCSNQWDGICANAALVEPACVGVGGSCP